MGKSNTIISIFHVVVIFRVQIGLVVLNFVIGQFVGVYIFGLIAAVVGAVRESARQNGSS